MTFINKIVLNLIGLCFVFGVFGFHTSDHQDQVIVIKYDLKTEDYTPVVLEAIKQLKSDGNKKIVFEKGTYHFYPEKAFEKYTAISNHDNGLRKSAFPILKISNLEIDGGDAEFLFHGKIIPFMIEKSTNIHIHNLNIDWPRTFNSEMEVVAVNKENRTVDFSISENYPYQIKNNQLIFTSKDYTHSLEMGIYFDPKTNAPVYNTVKYPPFKVFDGSFTTYNPKPEKEIYEDFITIPANNNKPLNITATELKPGLVRLKNINGELPDIGWFYIAKGYNSENRLVPAMRIYASNQTKLENINIYHAGGMGMIAEKCDTVLLNNFNVRLRAGTIRHLSTTADATHFVNCKGLVKIENCLFENQLDDATNIHGTYVEVTKILNDNKLEVKLGHFQQRSFDFANPNDTLTIVNSETFGKKRDFVLSKIEHINEKYYQLTFEKNISNDVNVGDYIDNSNWYPEVIIKNNKAINNRARGFLIASPKKVLIENNTFSNMNSAILLEASKYSWWYESGNVQDLTIKNNTFLDGTYGGGKCGLIEVHTQTPGIVNNIRIINNTFNSFNPMVLNIEGVNNLIFSNNKILQSNSYPILYHPKALLNFFNCQNVSVSDNKVEGFNDFALVNGSIIDNKFIANQTKTN